MEVQEYIDKMILIQTILLKYLDDEDNDQEELKFLLKLFNDQKIFCNKHLLRSVIRLLSTVIDYHHRLSNFFDKIFKIILSLKDELKRNFSNIEIYNFFKYNTKIILFLSEEKIIFFDKFIVSNMSNIFYDDTKNLSDDGKYLFPEIKQFFDNESWYISSIPEDIKEIRKTEYGDNYVLQLIHKDLIDEFILYINKTKCPLYKDIYPSIFETNLFILQSQPINYLQYAAFFGSVKIFKYLIKQNYTITNNLLLFAIYGRNPEIIHILEEYDIIHDKQTLKDCLKASIRCQHNELTNYILTNYFETDDISLFVLKESLKSYNFALIQPELINSDLLFLLCKRDYFLLFNKIMLECNDIDINSRILKEYNIDGEEVKKQKTLLFYAIENSNLEIVQLLLQHKDIDVNQKSYVDNFVVGEYTPLYGAVENGNIKIIQLLLQHKDIDINLKSYINRHAHTPLFSAVKNCNIDAVRILIKRNDIDINLKSLVHHLATFYETLTEYSALYQAVTNNDIEIVQLLLDHKDIDINAIITTNYLYADDEESHSRPKFFESTALFEAIWSNKTEIATLLLARKNINVNLKPNIYLLHRAIMNKNPEIVKMLIENKNIDINEKYNDKENCDTDIFDEKAINSSKTSVRDSIDESINNGNSMSCSVLPHYYEKTALFLAVENNDSEIVQVLIGNENIDVNMKSLIKNYHFSSDTNRKEKEEKDFKEITPLYLAVQNDNIEIVKMLVEHKNIDINLKSSLYYWHCKGIFERENQQLIIEEIKEENKEETPLHIAVSKGNLNIIKTLLTNKNININATDNKERKPIELSEDKEIRSMLSQ